MFLSAPGKMCLITVFLVNKHEKVSLFAALMRKLILKEFIKSIVSQQAEIIIIIIIWKMIAFQIFHARHFGRKCSKNFPLPKLSRLPGVCVAGTNMFYVYVVIYFGFLCPKKKINSTETWSLSLSLSLLYIRKTQINAYKHFCVEQSQFYSVYKCVRTAEWDKHLLLQPTHAYGSRNWRYAFRCGSHTESAY